MHFRVYLLLLISVVIPLLNDDQVLQVSMVELFGNANTAIFGEIRELPGTSRVELATVW